MEWKMKVESLNCLALELIGLLAEYKVLVILGIGLVSSVGLRIVAFFEIWVFEDYV